MSEFFKKYDLLNKLIAVFTSIVFWAIVMDIKNPVILVGFDNISLEYVSLNQTPNEYELVVTSEQSPSVDIKVKGPRSEVAQINNSNIIITCDLSSIKEPGDYQLTYSVKLPFSDMEVSSKSPEKLNVTIDYIATSEIPVYVDLIGEPELTYSFDNIYIAPSITISGPSKEIYQISSAYISIDTSNASSSITGEFDVALINVYGDETLSHTILQSNQSLYAHLPILQTISIPNIVDLVYGDIVNPKYIKGYEISPKYSYIVGEPQFLVGVDSIYLGEISVDDTRFGKSEFVFLLPELENIDYVDTTTSTAVVQIDFTDYTSQHFDVTNFIIDDISNNKKINVLADALEVEIFGSELHLNTLELDNLSIIANIFEDETVEIIDYHGNIVQKSLPLDVGTYNLKVYVDIDSSYEFDIYSDCTLQIEVLEVE